MGAAKDKVAEALIDWPFALFLWKFFFGHETRGFAEANHH